MKIFISYSKDRELVSSLANDLKLLGHEVWFDPELLSRGGQDWWENILLNVRQCDLFIFALTPRSLASEACKREYRYGNALNKRILPIMLLIVDIPTLPPELQKLQLVTYVEGGSKAEFAHLEGTFRNLP